MRKISFHCTDAFIDGLDRLVGRGLYPSRGEAIRVAIRDLLIKEKSWGNLNG